MTHSLRLLCIVAISTAAVCAHEVQTHQKMADASVAYLQSLDSTRPSLPNLTSSMLRIGARLEDDGPLSSTSTALFSILPLRSIFHFLPALNVLNTPHIAATCSSIDWGLSGALCTATIPFPPVTNDHGWSQALISDITTGLPNNASITSFGYVVHLLEDKGAPSHVRNDAHLCFSSFPLSVLTVVLQSCDPFHLVNDNISPNMPTGPPVIRTSNFSTPDQFFSSLESWVRENYYSDDTAFAPPGPTKVFEDVGLALGPQYLYGECIPNVSTLNTCKTPQRFGRPVRKLAHKGPLWHAAEVGCATGIFLLCDFDKFAGIDTTIAQEQYAELGPVIVQQVAAFIKFYAPALKVQVQGNGAVTSTSVIPPGGTTIPGNVNCASGTCSQLFVQGTQITLTATPSTVTWSGDCSSAGTSATVALTLTGDKSCTATFSHLVTFNFEEGPLGDPSGLTFGTQNIPALTAYVKNGFVFDVRNDGGSPNPGLEHFHILDSLANSTVPDRPVAQRGVLVRDPFPMRDPLVITSSSRFTLKSLLVGTNPADVESGTTAIRISAFQGAILVGTVDLPTLQNSYVRYSDAQLQVLNGLFADRLEITSLSSTRYAYYMLDDLVFEVQL